MPTHTTRPDQVEPRCWPGTGPIPDGSIIPWQDVLDTEVVGFDCAACIEDIRLRYRPRWLDEILFPGPPEVLP